jgi:hypothetical protein
MSRTTQYIGLNDKATAWLAKHRINGSSIDSYPMSQGIAGESIIGKIYKVSIGSFENLIAKEVVQFIIWSSGPMIFTHLYVYDNDEEMIGDIGNWKEDLNTKNEVDYANGTYYI